MRFALSILAASLLLATSSAIASPALPAENGMIRRQDGQLEMDNFCARFNKACVSTCTDGVKAGVSTKVILLCEGKSNWFNFGCKCGKTDRTAVALNKLGGLTTSTKTNIKKVTTTSTYRPTKTKTTRVTSTGSATTTLRHSTTSTSRTTSTIKTTTTTTFLSVLPTTFTSTSISIIPYTTQTTTSQTSASVEGLPIATTIPFGVIEVSVSPGSGSSRRDLEERATKNVLCRNFLDSCSRECSRVNSSPRNAFCRRTSTLKFNFVLGCLCRNGMSETRHALADIEESVDIVSTLKTETQTATVTRPTTLVQTLTGYRTLTFLQEVTSSFTITLTTSTSTTSTSISSTTFTPGTTTTTTTFNPIATKIHTSTTLQILAPTGVLRVRKAFDDTAVGYVKTSDASGNPVQLNTASGAKAEADGYMLVQDATNSGYYRLARTDLGANDFSIACELSSGSSSTSMSSKSANYCTLERLISQQTSAGPASMNPAGNFFQNSIQTFNWLPQIGTIPGVSGAQLKVYPQWFNPSGTTKPDTFMVVGGKSLFLTGDRAALQAAVGPNSPNAINVAPLYFAFES